MKKQTVWVVMWGYDTVPRGVFSTEQKAWDAFPADPSDPYSHTIEEFEIDR